MEKLPVLAIFFTFDYLDSPAPLLLFSPDSERKMCYAPTEYLKVIAYKQLGSGSVGDVYRALIEPDGPSTEHVKGPLTKAHRAKKRL